MNLDYDIFVIQSGNKKIKICFENKPISKSEYMSGLRELIDSILAVNKIGIFSFCDKEGK